MSDMELYEAIGKMSDSELVELLCKIADEVELRLLYGTPLDDKSDFNDLNTYFSRTTSRKGN